MKLIFLTTLSMVSVSGVWKIVKTGGLWRLENSEESVDSQHQIVRRKAEQQGMQVAEEGYRYEPSLPPNQHDSYPSPPFCVDVSTYQPLIWVESDGEECSTLFVKKCEDKSEEVCADVTETFCEVIPYTECSMGLEPQQFSETKLGPKKFVEKACTQGQKTIPHTKLLPECRNVTKQNCVTLWEKDQYGKQVWAGKEGCEPVTWQECKLVPKDVKFIVPEITCSDKQELWYHEPEPKTDTRMTNTYGCEVRFNFIFCFINIQTLIFSQVKSTTHCTPITRPDCKKITWNECRYDRKRNQIQQNLTCNQIAGKSP